MKIYSKYYENLIWLILSNYFSSQNVNEKWSILENDLLALLNKIAPEKKIVIQSQDSFPWIDDDLKYFQYLRDLNYKKLKK